MLEKRDVLVMVNILCAVNLCSEEDVATIKSGGLSDYYQAYHPIRYKLINAIFKMVTLQ